METPIKVESNRPLGGPGSQGDEKRQRVLAQQLAATLENLSDAFFTLDCHWCFTYVNARAEALLQSPRESLLGFSLWEKFPEAVGGPFQIEYQRAMTQGAKVNFEAFCVPLGLWLEVDAHPSAQGLAVYLRNVTERHTAEQQCREEREILTAVLNASTDAIISTDINGLIHMFNPGAERIFRRSRASVQGQPMEVLLPERFRAAHPAMREKFADSGDSKRMMGWGLVKGLRSDGQEIELEGTLSHVTIGQQQMLIASMRDVSERVRASVEFEKSRAQLSELTQKLMTQEKILIKRLAQVLHDQLGQTMAAIRMCHETIMTLQRDPLLPDVDRLQTQLGALIGQAIRQVRQVLVDLRPPLLEEQGLAAALDNELRNRSLSRPQLDLSIDVTPTLERMRWPAEVEYVAFMVAREAVENVLRHAQASCLLVRLSGSAISLQLEIVDNGVGIAPADAPPSGHLGILSMHERAHAVGAGVVISPADDQGTRVTFTWPCVL